MYKNVWNVIFISIFYSSCSQSLNLSSETNFIGILESDVPIYISNFPSYTSDEKRIREKLKVNLQGNGYFMVDEIEKSRFYLIFKSDGFLVNNLKNDQKIMCELNFILIKTKDRYDYFKSKNYLNKIIWKLQVSILRSKLLKKEDRVIEDIANTFLKNN